MCGIVGIFDSQGQRDIPETLLREMNDLLIHRGPDEGGISAAEAIGLLDALGGGGNGQVFSMKVTEKGCIGIRGIRGINVRFGRTMRVEEWEDLQKHADKINTFIKDNRKELEKLSAVSRAAAKREKAAAAA